MVKELPIKAYESVKDMLLKPEVKAQLTMGLPKMLSLDHFIRTTLTVLRLNPALLECTRASLLGAIIGAAQLGLEFEPSLGQAYIVPFKNRAGGYTDAVLIPGYRGYLTLARRSGEVESVSCEAVHVKDFFEIEYGSNAHIKHVPKIDEDDRGAFKGAYIIYKFKSGGEYFSYMTGGEIEKIKERSKASASGPWQTDYVEMAKKTVVRRSIKYVPVSIEMQRAASLEDRFYGGESQGLENLLPFEPAELESPGTVFERLISQKKYDRKDLNNFLVETARGNNMTVDELKAIGEKDFDNFWESFKAYAGVTEDPGKQYVEPTPEEPPPETEEPPPPEELMPESQKSTSKGIVKESVPPLLKKTKLPEHPPEREKSKPTPTPKANGGLKKDKVICPNIGAAVDSESCEQYCKHFKGCPEFDQGGEG